MEEDIKRCGNDLHTLMWYLEHPHHVAEFGDLVSKLARVTDGLVQVVVSTQLTNAGLAREFHAESAKALTAAVSNFTASGMQQRVA